MRILFISNLLILLLSGCGNKDQFKESNDKLVLQKSVNLNESGSYLISDFNYAKIDNERTIIVDFFGGKLVGLKNGTERFYQLNLKEIGILDGALQVGNIAFSKDSRFLYFPNRSRIVELDINNEFIRNINLSGQNKITADKFNSLFEYNREEQLFYVTLYRDAHKSLQYSDVPLVGAFNLEGELVKTIGEYPENYKNLSGNLSAWKYSFFDKGQANYFALFNRNNKIYQYDAGFKLLKTINLPPDFIATTEFEGKILNSFKKDPLQNIFYVIENEKIEEYNGGSAVKVKFKWFNLDTGEYGQHLLPNYMRIHQVMEDGTIILLDRNSKEDVYLNFYRIQDRNEV